MNVMSFETIKQETLYRKGIFFIQRILLSGESTAGQKMQDAKLGCDGKITYNGERRKIPVNVSC